MLLGGPNTSPFLERADVLTCTRYCERCVETVHVIVMYESQYTESFSSCVRPVVYFTRTGESCAKGNVRCTCRTGKLGHDTSNNNGFRGGRCTIPVGSLKASFYNRCIYIYMYTADQTVQTNTTSIT